MKKIYQRAMAVALAGTTLLGAGLWHKHHRLAPAPSKPVTHNADALPEGVSETTLADIRKSLEKQEYHISFDEQKKKLQSPNRRNNIRAYYEPGKLTVQTRVDTTGQGFKVELVNEGVFADGKLLYTPEITAKAAHHENKVQISHNAFTEEFINNEDGVRQNFIVENAPAGTRQLQVKMAAKGLKVEQGSGNELRFYSKTPDGTTRNELVYSDLKCWDANKKPLNASLAYVDNRIQISVDVANAAYPVTIDPIIANGTPQNANKILEINQSTMWLGFSVSSAGDVNGDGFGDVIVGAVYYDKNELNEGVAFVYYGNSSGNIDSNPGPSILEANVANARFGSAVQSAGDVNGDGYGDVIVGAKYLSNGNTEEGKAFVFHGSSSGIKPTASFSIEGEQNGVELGTAVAGAGDVNGDGYSDVLVGMPHYDDGGGMYVFYGNNSKGLKNNVRLFNTDLSSPLNYNQFNQLNFLGSLFAKSFIGKNKGKLVWETMGPGVPFSKVASNPITTSNQFTGAGNFVNLSSTGSLLGSPMLKIGVATKLRVRVRYSPVLALTGQMYGPWRYVQSQLAGYNNAPVPEEAMAETINHKANPEISEESSVTLFPNPASDKLSIQATNPGDIRSVRLFNTAGKLLYQSPRLEKDIDVSKLPGGVHILMIDRVNGTSTSHRILIRR